MVGVLSDKTPGSIADEISRVHRSSLFADADADADAAVADAGIRFGGVANTKKMKPAMVPRDKIVNPSWKSPVRSAKYPARTGPVTAKQVMISDESPMIGPKELDPK